MDKAKLKLLLKPLIKECLTEVIVESGLLRQIVCEVAGGFGEKQLIEETRESKPQLGRMEPQVRQKLAENKRKLLDAVGKAGYDATMLFEGTKPMNSPRQQIGDLTGEYSSAKAAAAADPLRDVDPDDPGIDISAFGVTKFRQLGQ